MKAAATAAASRPPIAYVRAKIHGMDVITNVLIDSGNLCDDLISLEFASALRLPIELHRQEIGTAAAGGTVEVIGRAKSFILHLEGLARPVIVSPIVVDKLAHTVNLGQAFLRRNSATLIFRPSGGMLQLQGRQIALCSPHEHLLRPSLDKRFQDCIKLIKEKLPRSELYAATKAATLMASTQTLQHPLIVDEVAGLKFRLAQNHYVRAGDQITALAYCGNANQYPQLYGAAGTNPVFIVGNENNHALAEMGVYVMPGIYEMGNDHIHLHIRNLGTEDKLIPQYCEIAFGSATSPMPSVNVLSHKAAIDLTAEELAERIKFLETSLKLNESPILRQDTKLRQALLQLFLDNFDAVSIQDNDFGKTNLVRFRIDVKPGTQPHKARVRPLNPLQEKDLRRQLDEWLDAKIIEPTVSAWGSALVPVRKKGTDKLRWAIDYRFLNQNTVKDSFPLALIDSNLQRLGGAKVFSTLDSAGAFHNLVVDPDCRDYTTFNSVFGQFRFVRLPFGVANGPAAYSRLVQLALEQITPGFALGYLDDIICYSPDAASHLRHLTEVVQVHTKCGMKLKLSKCKLFATEVEYLGHLVSEKGIRMIPSYVERVLQWPRPKDGAELRSFLGFAGYYRTFIKDFADLTADMNKFRMTKQTIIWTAAMGEQFEKLKNAFATAPVRGYPDYKNPNPFILDTDFSLTNMAAVLSQVQDGKEVFLGCTAKKCSAAESNYPSWKGELAAVILGVTKFEHILLARKFLLRTDNSAVTYLKNLKECRGMIGRWKMRLSSFDFELQHRAGTKQVNADSLSRMPGVPPSAEADEMVVPEEDQDILDVYALQSMVTHVPSDVAAATAADPDLRMLIPFLRKNCPPDAAQRKQFSYIGRLYLNVFECLTYVDGSIYFVNPVVSSVKKLCLPLSLFNSVFDLAHKHATAGHLGISKTREKILSRFFAPGLSAYIHSKIKHCMACVLKRSTISADKPAQHSKHEEVISVFNDKIFVDTVGPFNPPSRVNGRVCRHYLSILDGYSRYLVCVPIPDLETKTIAEAFVDNYALQFGLPLQIHSDNGSSFVSELFKDICKLLGIQKTTTPIYSPEGNRVERTHRLLGEIIRSFPGENYAEWGDRLKYAVFAYNTSLHRKLGISPYEAVYGVPPRIPLDLVYPTPPPISERWEDFCLYLKNKCQDTFLKIFEKRGIDGQNLSPLSKLPNQFSVGEKVYYFLNRLAPGVSAKLRTRWIGPYVVTRIISPSLIVIKPEGEWAKNGREMATIVSRVRKVRDEKDSETLNWDGQPLDLRKLTLPDDDLELFIQTQDYRPTTVDRRPETSPPQLEEVVDDYDEYPPPSPLPEQAEAPPPLSSNPPSPPSPSEIGPSMLSSPDPNDYTPHTPPPPLEPSGIGDPDSPPHQLPPGHPQRPHPPFKEALTPPYVTPRSRPTIFPRSFSPNPPPPPPLAPDPPFPVDTPPGRPNRQARNEAMIRIAQQATKRRYDKHL